jgi:hypothetical protein
MNIKEFLNAPPVLQSMFIYDLFSKKSNIKSVQKLFIINTKEHMNERLLSTAISSAIVHSQPQLFKCISDFLDTSDKHISYALAQALFNLALEKNEKEMFTYLDNKFSIIKNDLEEDTPVPIRENGLIVAFGGRFSLAFMENNYVGNKIDLLEKHYTNCFEFAIGIANKETVDFLLKKHPKINFNLVVNTFLDNIEETNISPIITLIENKKLLEILENHPKYKLCMNENTQYLNKKQEISKIVESVKMKNELDVGLFINNKSSTKPKI